MRAPAFLRPYRLRWRHDEGRVTWGKRWRALLELWVAIAEESARHDAQLRRPPLELSDLPYVVGWLVVLALPGLLP